MPYQLRKCVHALVANPGSDCCRCYRDLALDDPELRSREDIQRYLEAAKHSLTGIVSVIDYARQRPQLR